jgi:3-oxoacyl-(acyl-carrier-protein) synthase
MKMAEDLMLNPEIDRCLVVGAEEADWLLCDAYSRWRLLRDSPPAQVFATPARGMMLSEGAGAVLIDRSNTIQLETIHPGCNFAQRRDASRCVAQTFAALTPRNEDIIVASANGTFIDAAERNAILSHSPAARVYAPKVALGESVGAGAMWQVVAAVQALKAQELPAVPNATGLRTFACSRLLPARSGHTALSSPRAA